MELMLHTELVIDSAHKLIGHESLCKNFHGHSWFIEIWIKGNSDQKDDIGIIYDFGNVKKLKDKYDHQYLNDIPPFDKINPTAENITETIYNTLKEEKPQLKFKVRVYETYVGKKTYCEGGDF
jgi:6-pyruvoyltetrahydropterin/6-carboxytetrahydropterin synthase